MHIKIQEDSIKETLESSEKIDWKLNNFPWFFPIVHIGIRELEEGEIKTFANVNKKVFFLTVREGFGLINYLFSITQSILGALLYNL